MVVEKPINSNYRKAIMERLPEKIPMWELLGIEFIDVGRGWARMRMPFSKKMTNALGTAHGGALFTLADSACSMALVGMAEKGETVTTVEMKINYLRPLENGEVTAEAKILHHGKTTALGDVELKAGDGALVAKGSATFLRKKKLHTPNR